VCMCVSFMSRPLPANLTQTARTKKNSKASNLTKLAEVIGVCCCFLLLAETLRRLESRQMQEVVANSLRTYAAEQQNTALLRRRGLELGLVLANVVRDQGDCLPDTIAWFLFKGTHEEWLKQRQKLSLDVRTKLVEFLRNNSTAKAQTV
jgi:hypothetical protein